MRSLSLLVALALSWSSPASAYLVLGNVSCPGVVEEDEDPTFRRMNHWWVLGYLSALNVANNTEHGDGVSDAAIYEMLLDYCRSHPSKDIDDAAAHIYKTLK